MYEEPWYSTFVTNSQDGDASTDASRHRQQPSAMQPVLGSVQANLTPSEEQSTPYKARKKQDSFAGPPKATVARKVKSSGDLLRTNKTHKQSSLITSEEELASRFPETEVEFVDWYVKIEKDLVDAAHNEYCFYHKQILLFQSRLDTLVATVSSTIELLTALSGSLKTVRAETNGFQRRSQDILAEKQQLSRLIADLEENLQSYGYNDPKAKRSVASASSQSVRELEFSEAVATLDKYLEFLKAHPGRRESQIHGASYGLLLSRALTLIRSYFSIEAP